MSNFYPENYHDGDSEQENVAWNECDWYHYLGRNRREIRRVIDCYKSVRSTHANYLEELAKMMGWNSFVLIDVDDQGGEEVFVDTCNISQDEEEYEIEINIEPYTIHKNPLNLLTWGLYQYIQEQCEELLGSQRSISAINIWRLSRSLMDGQSNIMMATYSIDIAEYMLAICHLKLALKAVNESLQVIGRMPKTIPQVKEISMALFSLREVFIKVSNDCREYDQSELGDPE